MIVSINAGLNTYTGSYSVLGGIGGDGTIASVNMGGPGTLLIRDVRSGAQYTTLRIDNQGSLWSHFVDFTVRLDLDEIHLWRNASVRLMNGVRTINIARTIGDGSGYVYVQSGDVWYLDTAFTNSIAPVNIRIDTGGELVMPRSYSVSGTGYPAFSITGRLTNVRFLTVIMLRNVLVFFSAHTASRNSTNNALIQADANNTMRYNSVALFFGCQVIYQSNMGMVLTASSIDAMFGSFAYADFFLITTSLLDIESGSKFSAAGADRSTAGVTTGNGPTSGSGAGAGHASPGGGQPLARDRWSSIWHHLCAHHARQQGWRRRWLRWWYGAGLCGHYVCGRHADGGWSEWLGASRVSELRH